MSPRSNSSRGLASIPTAAALFLLYVRDERPDEGGKRKKDRRQERRVVVSEFSNKGGRCEGTSGTCHLIQDVDGGIHATKLLYVTTNNVSRDDAADLGTSGKGKRGEEKSGQ
jgi:hypothetical protein